MPRANAELVPDDYDRAQLPVHMHIRTCHVCRVDFFVDTRKSHQLKRVYCSERCKERSSTIRSYLRRNGHPTDIIAYLDSPDDFPPINPFHENLVNKTPWIQTPRKPVPPESINPQLAPRTQPKAKPNRTREDLAKVHAAEARAREREARLQERKISLKEQESIKQQAEAIKDARKALSIMPLSDQSSDILSGKRTFLPETDIAQARAAINVIVTNNLLIAEKVMDGEVTWSPQQLSLFRALLNKVVPDAAAVKPLAPKSKKTIEDYSIEELEDLVSKAQDEELKVVNSK